MSESIETLMTYWRTRSREVIGKALAELNDCTPTPGVVHAKLYKAFRSMHAPEAALIEAQLAWLDVKTELLAAK